MKAYLDNYIGELLSLGRYCFTRKELGERFDVGDIANELDVVPDPGEVPLKDVEHNR